MTFHYSTFDKELSYEHTHTCRARDKAYPAISDGTYLFEEIWPDKDLQNLTREEKDPDHLHGEEIMRFVSDLHAKKVVYHSISHLPGLTHNKLQEQLPKGQFIGFDGMDIV